MKISSWTMLNLEGDLKFTKKINKNKKGKNIQN